MTVISPCIGLCELDDRTGWCRGCRRDLAEIAAWGSLDERDRRAILAVLPDRRIADEAGAADDPSPSRQAAGP